jgi:CubicO group peptidase (beta-lactamase class C family)
MFVLRNHIVKVLLSAFLATCLSVELASAEELPRAMPPEVGLSPEKLDRVKALAQAAVDKNQTAGVVVLVARKGQIAFLETFGKLSLDSSKPMPPDAIFRIYSMTKPVTTVAALMLYEDGKLKLDDPVSKYLPAFSNQHVYAGDGKDPVPANPEMTIRDLMRHTSGLGYGLPQGSAVDRLYIANGVDAPGNSLADMVARLGKLPLHSQPGTRFEYSLSTDVLGRIVEVVSGKSLDEFMEERIFRPLDMKDTGFFVPADKLNRLTASYVRGRKGTLKVSDSPTTSRYRKRPKFLSGGGGLLSTARDYSRFCQMLLNGGQLQGVQLLRPETVGLMTTNQLPRAAMPISLGGFKIPGLGFGLGVSVKLESPAAKPNTVGEYGWSGAASTFFWIAPRPALIAIILQQVEPLDLSLQLAINPAVYAAIEESNTHASP